jgi:hypothetical protein
MLEAAVQSVNRAKPLHAEKKKRPHLNAALSMVGQGIAPLFTATRLLGAGKTSIFQQPAFAVRILLTQQIYSA